MVMAAMAVVHRLGKAKKEGPSQKPRPVIIRFLSRSARDVPWRISKKNAFLKSNHLHVKEDLTAEDKEMRSHLWPFVEQAREKGGR